MKVARHINGIFINPLEYLLDDGGKVMEFENRDTAVEYLRSKVASDEDISYMVFEE